MMKERVTEKPTMTTGMTIGKVAQAAQVGVETIRFYERKGLLAQPPRGNGGYRLYPPEAVTRVLFIRRAKGIGFTLEEIRELLVLGAEPGRACADVRLRAEAKIGAIDARIETLQQMRAALVELAALCREAPPGECPLLAALEGQRRASAHSQAPPSSPSQGRPSARRDPAPPWRPT